MGYNASNTHTIFRTSEAKKGKELIMQSTARVLDYDVGYRLYRLKRSGKIVYQIYAGYRRDRIYCSVGSDRVVAESIFAAIVKGKVTPCSLKYIIEDLLPDIVSEESAS